MCPPATGEFGGVIVCAAAPGGWSDNAGNERTPEEQRRLSVSIVARKCRVAVERGNLHGQQRIDGKRLGWKMMETR
ncbi:UNVERIFIED_CONTAM: hypothetical protein Slati_2883900 [Sesamum latifolium]|uniref:Uncharacterized protein n=1 Tax=Sesamum latifolium TaxID=2727402 RepID=A0AAW2VHC9_9LAMI